MSKYTQYGKKRAFGYNRPRPQKTLLRVLSKKCNKQISVNRRIHKKILRGKRKMSNERITEDFVRTWFKEDSLFRNIKLEEQKTTNKLLKELLKTASKKNTGKTGYPEFIITFPSIMDLVLIIECKADTKYHKSKTGNEPEKYAVDGALHYSKYLNDEFNVIAIAVSGENINKFTISNFFIKKKEKQIKELTDKKLLSIYDYLNLFEEKENIEKLKDRNVITFASELNQELYNYSVPENERAIIVSGILIALQNKNFRESYKIEKKPSELVEDLLKAIERVLISKKMGEKTKILMEVYSKIQQSNKLAITDKVRNNETGLEEQNTILRNIVFQLDKNIFPFTAYENIGYDILGQFYSEFVRYVNGDKKLGLVLTPKHVTELFVDIAELNVNDVIYDNCCGTGGFLIKAMKKLFELAGNDNEKKKEIKERQLIGIEDRSDMFTYACSNMMMRGDGRSNIYLGDSLNNDIKEKVKIHKPNVGFLNPPYATAISELEFVYQNLECLEKNGLCVAIIPINCVSANSGKDYEWKEKLLEKHTLEAVFSMPVELFYPTGTVTVIVVFKAHSKHPKDYQTYFGYWRDDGFVKVKNLGRIDFNNKWGEIEKDWLYNYKNRNEVKNQSVKRIIAPTDDWCAENFLKTDYGDLKEEDFLNELKKYVLFNLFREE